MKTMHACELVNELSVEMNHILKVLLSYTFMQLPENMPYDIAH